MKLSTKLFSTVAACGMVLGLAACGNTAKTSSSKSEAVQSSKVTKKNSSNTSEKAKSSSKHSQKTISSTSTSSQDGNTDSAVSSSSMSKGKAAAESSSTSAANSSSAVSKQYSSQQATMNATDAKNIVKEHIGNQLNNRGVAGQSTSDLPSIDSIDGYTATQNGTNNWTVSGNGHTYHVTANSVTGN